MCGQTRGRRAAPWEQKPIRRNRKLPKPPHCSSSRRSRSPKQAAGFISFHPRECFEQIGIDRGARFGCESFEPADLIALKRRVLPKRPQMIKHLVEALVDSLQLLISLHREILESTPFAGGL